VTWARAGNLYQLRLEPGEDVPATIVAFVRERDIGSGLIAGLGAADKVVLGYFDRGTRQYEKREFPGECEIASITGNIAWAGAEPVCHLHAVVAGAGQNAWAGHLFEAKVTVTCEVSIVAGQGKLRRAEDMKTGLNLLDLSQSGQGG